MHFVIFTGGKLKVSKLVKDIIKSSDQIIAADSGADTALKLKVIPNIIVGDFDSISKKTLKILENKKIKLIKFPTQKDETDTQLAINFAIKNKATKISLLGGTMGDRIDHILANLLFSTTVKTPIYLINGNQISFIKKGPAKIYLNSKKNDLLSLIPIKGDVNGITTENLYYPLINQNLEFGDPIGISNVFTKEKISIEFKEGILFITHIII